MVVYRLHDRFSLLQSMEMAKQYLPLDSQKLKECSLDFSGIPLERGACYEREILELAGSSNGKHDCIQTLEYSGNTYRPHCKNLDRYCLKHIPAAGYLTEELVLDWVKRRPGEAPATLHGRAGFIRGFGWYLKKPISFLISLWVEKVHLSTAFFQMMNCLYYSMRSTNTKADAIPSNRFCSPRFSD